MITFLEMRLRLLQFDLLILILESSLLIVVAAEASSLVLCGFLLGTNRLLGHQKLQQFSAIPAVSTINALQAGAAKVKLAGASDSHVAVHVVFSSISDSTADSSDLKAQFSLEPERCTCRVGTKRRR
jgi:hypothetical protein